MCKTCLWPRSAVGNETADTGVASSILARSHTFVGIDNEIISKASLLLPLSQEGLCQLQAKALSFTSESICTKYWLTA